jgi:predicted ribosomally synthesized peptide with nif11-like leader
LSQRGCGGEAKNSSVIFKARIPRARTEGNAMSVEAAMDFVQKLPANPQLAGQVLQAVEGKDAKAAAAAVSAIGKTQGHDFTPDEAIEARHHTVQFLRGEKIIGDELSEEELNQVAGGLTFYASNFTRIGSASYWQSVGSGFSQMGNQSFWRDAGRGAQSLGSASTWQTTGNAIANVFKGW